MTEFLNLSADFTKNQDFTILYSGEANQTHRKSYLAFFPKSEFISHNFSNMEEFINNNLCFGYFSYELKNYLENLTPTKKSFISSSNIHLVKYKYIIEYDHNKKKFNFISKDKNNILDLLTTKKKKIGKISIQNLQSNFTKQQYLDKVLQIKEKIKDGEIYQANLTRKFFGTIIYDDPYDIFLKLNQNSPANYSSLLKLGNKYVISSSPELFLSLKDNIIKSSPIKGTIARGKTKYEDLQQKEILKNSSKDKAENLMIVDLVRNDIGRNALKNTIEVKNIFQISTYKTIHHMSSDVIGIKKEDSSVSDIIKGCFPPGSMTGAPKLQAMKICADLEKQDRGIYSGAIGMISKDYCHLSVVIRTIIIEDNKFELQVGGAITHDSNPQNEWQETMDKIKPICRILDIDKEISKF